MSTQDVMKKIARELAEQATRVEKQADLQSVLSNPYVQNAALGAGAGGLLGLVRGKNKRRAMLDYALMGGVGGLGATAAKDMLFKKAPPPAPVAKAVGEDGSVAGPLVGVTAMGAGGYAGNALHNAVDQYGKLDRVMKNDKAISSALSPLRAVLDRGDVDKDYQALRGVLGDKDFSKLLAMHRSARQTGPAGNAAGRSAQLLADAADLVGPAGAKGITGKQLQSALSRLPRGRGRVALPIMGALAVPALWNAFTAPKAE